MVNLDRHPFTKTILLMCHKRLPRNLFSLNDVKGRLQLDALNYNNPQCSYLICTAWTSSEPRCSSFKFHPVPSWCAPGSLYKKPYSNRDVIFFTSCTLRTHAHI